MKKIDNERRTMTVVFVGTKEVVVPCIVAQETKRLINKFRLKVTDIDMQEPYYMDDVQCQDDYELTITVAPNKVLKSRRFKSAIRRTNSKLIKRYGWDLTVIEE